MKTRLIRALVVSALAGSSLAAAAPALAQQPIPSPYRFVETSQAVNVFVGYTWMDAGALDLGPTGSPYFGARYGIRLTGPIVLEGELGYAPSTRAVRDTVPGDTTLQTVGEADQNLLIATGALRFDLTGPRTYRGLQPFLRANGGVVFGLSDGGAAEEELPADVRFDFGTTFAMQLGAGFEWFASPGMTFRVDGGVMLWQIETPLPFLLGEEGLNRPNSEWTQNYSLTAALVLRF